MKRIPILIMQESLHISIAVLCIMAGLFTLIVNAMPSPPPAVTTIYVAPNGNDAAAGTATAPLKTLQKAADKVKGPGDRVVAKAGTYPAGFVLGWDTSVNGTAAAPIVFEAEPGVIIAGANFQSNGIQIVECDYVTIRGFRSTARNVGSGIRGNGTKTKPIKGLKILDNFVDGAETWGIYVSHAEDVVIEGNTACNTGEQHGIYGANSLLRPIIRNNILFKNGRTGLQLNGDASQGGTGMIDGAIVQGNVIYENVSKACNFDGVTNMIFERNVIHSNIGGGPACYQTDGAKPSTNNTFRNNTIYQLTGAAVSLGTGNEACTGNIFIDNVLVGGIRSNAKSPPAVNTGNLLTAKFINTASKPPDLHLQPGSPDVGAYAGIVPPPPPPPLPEPTVAELKAQILKMEGGDINRDGRVDVQDLTIVANNFNR